MMAVLKEVLVAVAGFVGGFVSILASNGSSITLPALEFFGLPEHVANGTNRLSVVALGLVGTIHFSHLELLAHSCPSHRPHPTRYGLGAQKHT